MKAIGFCKTNRSSVLSPWTKAQFTNVFHEFCTALAHQPCELFFSDSSIFGEEDESEFEKLLDYLEENGEGFLVVVPDATHVSEDLEGIARSVVKLEQQQSDFFCLEEDYPDILQNAFQHIQPPGVSSEKSRNIRKAMQARAIEGKSLGKPPFGYTTDGEGKFLPDCDESTIVRRIYQLYANDDLGLRKIVEILNGEGLVTRSGNDWNIVSIRDILKNTSYIGTYTRFGLRLTKNHEPLIETELFRSAQDKVRERKRYRGFANSLPYLLSGLCICGYCGNGLMGVNRRQTWKRQDGTRMRGDYRYYQCQSRANKGTCGYHTWPTEKLEERVLNLIKEALESGTLQKSMSGLSGEEKRHQAATKRLRKVESAEKRFIEFMRKTSRGQSVVARLSLYINNLDLARTQAFISIDLKSVNDLLCNWKTKSFVEQQSFLDEYLNFITVKDRSVRIHY